MACRTPNWAHRSQPLAVERWRQNISDRCPDFIHPGTPRLANGNKPYLENHHGHNSVISSDLIISGRLTNMALQQRLGLLSNGGIGAAFYNPVGLCLAR